MVRRPFHREEAQIHPGGSPEETCSEASACLDQCRLQDLEEEQCVVVEISVGGVERLVHPILEVVGLDLEVVVEGSGLVEGEVPIADWDCSHHAEVADLVGTDHLRRIQGGDLVVSVFARHCVRVALCAFPVPDHSSAAAFDDLVVAGEEHASLVAQLEEVQEPPSSVPSGMLRSCRFLDLVDLKLGSARLVAGSRGHAPFVLVETTVG